MTKQAGMFAAVAVVMIAVLSGCPAQLQEACSDKADCASELDCFEPKFVTKTETCTASSLASPGKTCNLLCETDADCAVLGDDVGCFSFGCPGSDSYCVRKNSRGEPVGAELKGADAGS